MNKQIYVIDGKSFSTLDEFWGEISDKVIPGTDWGRNLDAFNDILRGGFGTPEIGFVLIWKNSSISREKLGYSAAVIELEKKLQRCHSANIDAVKRDLESAKRLEGGTVFDWILEIIQSDEHKEVELRLE